MGELLFSGHLIHEGEKVGASCQLVTIGAKGILSIKIWIDAAISLRNLERNRKIQQSIGLRPDPAINFSCSRMTPHTLAKRRKIIAVEV